MISIALYPIVEHETVHPHYTVKKAFERHFFPCYTYDWVSRWKKLGSKQNAQKEFLQVLTDKKPDYAFLQLQNPDHMSIEMVREYSKHTKVINWCGDVRDYPQWHKWFEEIGKEIYLTLFSNMTDVEIMRDRGIRCDYLQIGYDQHWYYPGIEKSGPEIVFCANHYPQFPLAKYRAEVVKALSKEFGDNFKLHGSGWEKEGIRSRYINCETEGQVYRNAKIAISVSNFNYVRYHSDRLLRIMGSECLPISHEYFGLTDDYGPGENIVTFSDIPELIERCHYYLKHEDVRKIIARNAHMKAINDCTWDNRCKELIQLIERYD